MSMAHHLISWCENQISKILSSNSHTAGPGMWYFRGEELLRALWFLDRRIGTLRHVQDRTKMPWSTVALTLSCEPRSFYSRWCRPSCLRNCHQNAVIVMINFTKKGIFDSSLCTAVAKTSSEVFTPAMLLTLLQQLRVVAPFRDEGNKQPYFMPCAFSTRGCYHTQQAFTSE